MSYLALSASFEHLCYGSTAFINIVILTVWGPPLYVRICVYRWQILTYKGCPRAERVSYTWQCDYLQLRRPEYVRLVVSPLI